MVANNPFNCMFDEEETPTEMERLKAMRLIIDSLIKDLEEEENERYPLTDYQYVHFST